MSKSLCLAVSLLLVSPLCAADVFKCIKDGGRTVYQNFPCPIDSIGSQATQPPPAPPAAPRVPVEAGGKGETVNAAAIERAAADRAAAPGAGPRPGMTKADVRASSWGEPAGVTENEAVEIWTYDTKHWVLFDHEGIVRSVTPSP